MPQSAPLARDPDMPFGSCLLLQNQILEKKPRTKVRPPPDAGLSAVASVLALRDVCPLIGGSMPHLVICSDRNLYVVKFLNNPQGPRVLANELFSFHLANLLGLPTFPAAIVVVDKTTLEQNPGMSVTCKPNGGGQCEPGLAFGSRYEHPFSVPLRPPAGTLKPVLPSVLYSFVENGPAFLGMVVFDNWVMNSDWRQVVYLTRNRARSFRAYMIDNGLAFLGGLWGLPSADKYSHPNLCDNRREYRFAKSIDSFEPWLNMLETGITLSMLENIANTIPKAWCVGDQGSLEELVQKLDQRRSMVREIMISKYFTPGHAPNLTYHFGCDAGPSKTCSGSHRPAMAVPIHPR